MGSNQGQPLVSVGLPVYDRPKFLSLALESLAKQSYKNLEIVISDDCSPGEETQKVVQEFMEKDPRIQYYRQDKNLGQFLNHRFVCEKATGEYFFWANEDDEWHEKYIEVGIQTLLSNPYYDAWCCTIRNTDSFGRVIREYPGFSRWTSTKNKRKDIMKYLLEPEIMGKAHVFHSIFRRSALSKTINEYWFNENWGTDMCFGLAFLTRFNLIATDEVLFDKRVVRPSDNEKEANPIVIKNPNRHIFPLTESVKYIHEYYKAVRTTPYKNLVILVMISRLPTAVRNDLLSFQAWERFFHRVVHNRITRRIKRLLLPTISSFSVRDMFWRRQFSYKHDPQTVDVGWGTIRTSGVIQVPLHVLRAPIVTPMGTRLMAVEETPHYHWIKALIEGDDDAYSRDKYREYLETFYPEVDLDEGLADVVSLVSSLQTQSNSDSLITVVTHPPTRNRGSDPYVVIYDGVHRSAIAKALGHKFIQCRLVPNRIHSHHFAPNIFDEQNTDC